MTTVIGRFRTALVKAGYLALLFGNSVFSETAHADLLDDIKERGSIIVATEMRYAPFDMVVEGRYQGLCKDLFDAVAHDLGVKAVYADLPWPSILPGLAAKRFDLVNAPVASTPVRQKRYAFTHPIGIATVGLLKRARDTQFMHPTDLAGRTVGVQKGSAELQHLKEFTAPLEDVTIREYISTDDAMVDLGTGRIDAVANALPLLQYAVQQRPESFALVSPPLSSPGYFSWITRKDAESARLLEAVNASLQAMHDDGRLEALRAKWLKNPLPLPRTLPTS